jgi:long-chain acyl-CoA synthetase
VRCRELRTIMNLGNLLSASAFRNPSQAAVVFGDESVSYEQFDAATTSFARGLLAQGCQPGDRVALHWPNSIEMVKLLFACFKAGLIAVPVNVSMKAPEVAHILSNSQAVMCFAHPDREQITREASQGCTTLRKIHTSVKAISDSSREGVLPDVKSMDSALILYTSGSTARPKGATHTHGTLLQITNLTRKILGDGLETVLAMTQMSYISAICACLLPAVACGATTVIAPGFDAPLILDLIERFHCTYTFGLPSMLQFMMEEQTARPRNVCSLRTLIASGDSVPPQMQERFQTLFGIPVQEAYGMTEAGPIACNPAGRIRAGSLGTSIDGVEMRVLDAAGGEVPDGQSGEIVLRSPATYIGYWDNPAATLDTLRGGWLYTGDLGHRDRDGYFWFDGRKKEIIVRGGYNISPQEVEETIQDHPAVLEVAVIGVPVPVYGESVVAFVALRNERVAGDQELKDHASKRLADLKVPEQIFFVESLPKGITGKVQRRALKELALAEVS